MNRFVQIHLLTAYPPSNPNRDDLGRPKTAVVGGVQRQRISSQAIKRALRQSDAFQQALAGTLGERTQRLGEIIAEHLVKQGADKDKAGETARRCRRRLRQDQERNGCRSAADRAACLHFPGREGQGAGAS